VGFAVWPGWGFAVWPGWPAGFLRQFAVARLAGWVFAAIKVARPGWGFAVWPGWVCGGPAVFLTQFCACERKTKKGQINNKPNMHPPRADSQRPPRADSH
jgi:hypothetical protein